MKQIKTPNFKKLLVSGVSALAFMAIGAVAQTGTDFGFGTTAAFASDDSAGGGKGNQGAGGQGQGGQGASGQGKGGQGGHNDGGSADAGDDDSDGRGPKYGQPSGDRGGKPVWAQEGIPEVELGRLNVIRSPDQVLARALAEAIANFDPATMEAIYEMSAASFASYVQANWDTISIIDSPLENLAILEKYWTTGAASLPGVSPASSIDYAAILIGTASDKNVPISFDTVAALAAIVGVSISDGTIASIALRAEAVRDAILVGHG